MTDQLDSPLVGAAHQQLVASLVRLVEAGRGQPRVVVIEGDSGVGKSRVVREVYSALVAGQSQPGYWPPITVSAANLLSTRKVLGPGRKDFPWPADALPDFLWWDVDCELLSDGDPLAAVRLFSPFLERHVVPMALALSERRGLPASLAGDLRRSLDGLVREGGTEAGLEALQRTLGLFDLAIPGMGLLADRVMRSARWLKSRRDAGRALAVDGWLTAPGESMANEMAGQLRQMTAGILPGVIAIEDLHLMGSDLAELLRALQGADDGLLVIATAWPEGRHRPVYAQWLRESEAAGTVRIDRLGAPAAADLGQIVRLRAPKTPSLEAEEIARLWPNPYVLLLLLGLARTRKRIVLNEGRLPLDPDLKREPREVPALYRERLLELPPEVRTGLAVAAGCLPDVGTDISRFLSDIVARAASDSGLFVDEFPDEASIVNSLQRALWPFDWCLEPEPGVTSFREWHLQHAAHVHLTDQLIEEDDVQQLRDLVIATLADHLDRLRGDGYSLPISDAAVVAASAWLVGSTEWGPAAGHARLAGTICLARSRAAAYRYRSALELCPTSLQDEALAIAHPDLLAFLADLAWWLSWTGQFDEALALIARVQDRMAGQLGPRSAEVMRLRARAAYINGTAGRIDAAVAAFADLAAEARDEPALPDRLRHHIARQRARWLGVQGHYVEACEILEPLAVVMRVAYPEGDRECLLVESNLAYLSVLAADGSDEELEECLGRYERLVDMRHRFLGASDPDTLDARRNHAWLLGRKDPPRALQEVRELLMDSREVLDVDHRHVLATTLDLAVMAVRCADILLADEAMADLLDACSRNPSGSVGILSEYGRLDVPADKIDEVAAALERAHDGGGETSRRARALSLILRAG